MTKSPEFPPRAMRPADVELDPRTDGVEDDGARELPPLDTAQVEAGVEHDREHARRLGEL
jgi:hypothetical protein